MAVSFNLPCNTIKILSNKEKNPKLIPLTADKIAIPYKTMRIVVLKPIIDKITFGFLLTPAFLKHHAPHENLDEYRESIKKSLWQQAKMGADGLSFLEGVSFLKKPYSGYNLNLCYKPPSGKGQDFIFMQVAPKGNSSLPFMKFDFNPSRFSQKALEEFQKFIEETLVIPGATIFYADFITASKIYRADVAVDILGVRPAELEVSAMKLGKPFPCKSHTYKSQTGRTETLYLKVHKGQNSSEYVYDKRTEQIDQKQPPMYGDFLHSRFECRIGKTTFHKLSGIQNRCKRVMIRSVDYSKFNKLKYAQKLFIKYALHRSLDKALEIMPPKQGIKMKQAYNDTIQAIWEPDLLWSHWSEVVEKSGLFPK